MYKTQAAEDPEPNWVDQSRVHSRTVPFIKCLEIYLAVHVQEGRASALAVGACHYWNETLFADEGIGDEVVVNEKANFEWQIHESEWRLMTDNLPS